MKLKEMYCFAQRQCLPFVSLPMLTLEPEFESLSPSRSMSFLSCQVSGVDSFINRVRVTTLATL
jgi:hypothetical protein